MSNKRKKLFNNCKVRDQTFDSWDVIDVLPIVLSVGWIILQHFNCLFAR